MQIVAIFARKKRKITAVTLQQIDDNNSNSGTELSKRGVFSLSDSGRGDKIRRRKLAGDLRNVSEASKKKVASATGSLSALA